MAAWHHRFNGRESEQALGDAEGEGGLACCSPWGRKEPNMTERQNNNNKSSNKSQEFDTYPFRLFILNNSVQASSLTRYCTRCYGGT